MKHEVSKQTIFNGQPKERTFIYYLTSNDSKIEGFESKNVTQYGICVSDKEERESCSVESVSTDKQETIELIHKLSENSVTPTSLNDVIYDWLCDKYTVYTDKKPMAL